MFLPCQRMIGHGAWQPWLRALEAREVRPGTAASVRKELWEAAMIFPEARNPQVPLTPQLREAFSPFFGVPLAAPAGRKPTTRVAGTTVVALRPTGADPGIAGTDRCVRPGPQLDFARILARGES